MSQILVTGDYYPGYRTENLTDLGDFKSIFGDFLEDFKNSDLSITNLEAPVLKSGNSVSKTGPAIKAKPQTLEALFFAGFKLVTLANNHIMDYGYDGLKSTFDTCNKLGIKYFGAGKNLSEARKPFNIEVGGIKLSFLNFAENEFSTTNGNEPGANPLNPIENHRDIVLAKSQADYVVVICHGGHEMYPLPSPRMKSTFRFYIESGADVVINHHTHCFSGFELYQDKPIFYSLGNFIFDWPNKREDSWYQGYYVKLTFEHNNLKFEIVPYFQNKDKVGLKRLTESQIANFNERLRYLNSIINNDLELENRFNEYCRKSAKMYNSFIEPHRSKIIRLLQRKKIIPSLLTKEKRLLYLNLMRCESHRDVLINILRNDSNT